MGTVGGFRLSRVRLAARWGLRVAGGAALVTVPLTVFGGTTNAQSLPFCGGQNAPPRPVPYTCTTQTQTIDGSQVFAIVHADGQTVTVTFHLITPRTSDAPIRINHHIGISGAGGPQSSAQGVIPAGQTAATLSVTTPCVAGQVDIKFVFILDSQPQGRVGGPWIENGTGCTTPTTSTSTTTTPTTTPTTSPTTTPTTPPSTPATTVPSSVAQSVVGTTLPVTGRGSGTFNVALVAVVIGSLFVVIAGARKMSTRSEP